MVTSLGRLPEFSGAVDEWEILAEQLTYYFAAIKDEDKQRAILLSVCGIATYKLLKTLVAPTALTTKAFAELVQLATDHHHPKPSVIMRRFRFNTCVCEQGESITSFVTRLRDLASHCEYGEPAKELIRDRLVYGIHEDVLQCSRLAVAGLTFQKAFGRALLHESAVQNARLLSVPVAVHCTPVELRPAPGEDRPRAACYHCGGSHASKECRFHDSICKYCHKKGDIQRVCCSCLQQQQPEPAQSPQQQPQRRGGQQRRMNKVDGETLPTHAPTSTSSAPSPQPFLVNYNMFVIKTDSVAIHSCSCGQWGVAGDGG